MEEFVLILFVISSVICSVPSQDKSPVLNMFGKNVEINGVTEILPFEGHNFTIYKYFGIPYAQPPVGELRFRKPEPIRSMETPFHATEHRSPCIQFNFDYTFPQSEDCLYLNIYKPGIPRDSLAGHAVAIWIHGGSFIEGSANQYNATFLSLFGNVIIVTINYRLGPYGFLSTEDDNAPGNYALWDQIMAFQWVHDYIEYFGGDKNRVTIFGESAGAISALHQGLIPQNRGLFQRIIAQSGSAFIPAYPKMFDAPVETAKNLGVLLDCDTSQNKLLMDCLRNRSNDKIKTSIKESEISLSRFSYIVDNVLVKRDANAIPYIIDKQPLDEVEFYRSLDVMNGFNSHDGYFIAEKFGLDAIESREEFEQLLHSVLPYFTGVNLDDSVIKMITDEYTNWTDPNFLSEVKGHIIALFTDYLFGAPAVETALMHAMSPFNSGNYMYHFTANPPFGPLTTPEWIHGANHADELPFVFGVELFMQGKDPATTWEIQLSRKMVTYWSNFMKSGNPNQPEPVSPKWPSYDNNTQSFLKLEENTTDKSVGQFLKAEEHNFWYNEFPRRQIATGAWCYVDSLCNLPTSGVSSILSTPVPVICTILIFIIVL